MCSIRIRVRVGEFEFKFELGQRLGLGLGLKVQGIYKYPCVDVCDLYVSKTAPKQTFPL